MTARAIGIASLVGATLLGMSATARPVHADADEASLDVEAIGGVARLEDGLAKKTASGPLVGLGGRFTFARSNLLQWEGRVAVATAAADYVGLKDIDVGGVPRTGDLTRRTTVARLELGATLRFGVRFVPTLHLGVGAQARMRSTGALNGVAVDSGGTSADLIGAGAVGFDYRFGPRTVAGVSLGATIAVPLGSTAYQAIEGGVHFAHYWYPRW
jgi:hypothetical protein